MSKRIPDHYLDDTYGLKPYPTQESFNNVLFSYEKLLGDYIKASNNKHDIDLTKRHLKLNKDEYGLYKPKNSHDNMTAKLLICETFNLEEIKENMSLWKMIIFANFHPRDVIIYTFLKGGFFTRLISRFFLWIPALAMIHSCVKKWKVRPVLSFKERIKIFFDFSKRRKIIPNTQYDGYVERFTLSNGKEYSLRYMQNDGKILAPLRLYNLKDQSWTMKLCGKICQRILRKRYGKNYMSTLYSNYFYKDKYHPVRLTWKDIEDFL